MPSKGVSNAVAAVAAGYALVRSVGALGAPATAQRAASSVPPPRTTTTGGADVDVRPTRTDRARALEPGRGRQADRPGEVPAAGWRDIVKRALREVKADNVPLLSAGVAFYALLSLVPALVAVISIYGLVADPGEVARQLRDVTDTMPREAATLLVDQAERVASSSGGGLGVGVAAGIVAALWSASSGMKWLLTALSLVEDEEETRKFVKLRGTALLLTIGAAGGFVTSTALIAATPVLADAAGLGSAGALAASILRWPLLAALVVTGLSVLYRYGPDRDAPKWRWVSWGSAIAGGVWLVASIAFAAYAAVAGSYDASYGAIGGVVVLMLWLYLSVFSILLGAEINTEMERQTARDTTRGPDLPLGQRDAAPADQIGAAAG